MDNKKLFEKYIGRVSSLEEDTFDALFNDVAHGKNTYLRLTRKGSSLFDPSWIEVVEDVLFDLGEIINNPREVTTKESSVVPIELAKKVDSESVQHLASHTQFIKDINEYGEVIPGKILTHFNREEIKTYENRFIATFVRRLVLFIEKRYEFIKHTIKLESKDILIMRNSSIVNGEEVEIETKVSVKKQMSDDYSRAAKEYIARIELMREYVTYYYNSPFMRLMKNERDVRRPILQTNIIRKNPKYHKCFEAFMFIERFESLGVSYKIDETYHDFSELEQEQMTYVLLSQYLALQDENSYDVIKENHKVYKPKVLTSIDDEKFLYDDLYKGPIEFVRVDEAYKNYLKNLINDKLPTHPTMKEKEFYSEDYATKKNLLAALKEIDRLISRVEKDIAKWEVKVQELIKQRDKDEAEEAKRKLEALKAHYQKLLEEKRQAIIRAAQNDKVELPAYVKQEISSLEESPIEEVEEEKQTEVVKEVEPSIIYVASGESHVEIVDGRKVETIYVSEVTTKAPKKEEKKKSSGPKFIPGQFIIKGDKGYYVSDNVFSDKKEEAYVFDDFNQARYRKNRIGGKVIKL